MSNSLRPQGNRLDYLLVGAALALALQVPTTLQEVPDPTPRALLQLLAIVIFGALILLSQRRNNR